MPHQALRTAVLATVWCCALAWEEKGAAADGQQGSELVYSCLVGAVVMAAGSIAIWAVYRIRKHFRDQTKARAPAQAQPAPAPAAIQMAPITSRNTDIVAPSPRGPVSKMTNI